MGVLKGVSVALQSPEDFKVSLIQVVAIDTNLPLDPFQTGERTAKRAQRRVVHDPEVLSDVLELGECSAKRGEVGVPRDSEGSLHALHLGERSPKRTEPRGVIDLDESSCPLEPGECGLELR